MLNMSRDAPSSKYLTTKLLSGLLIVLTSLGGLCNAAVCKRGNVQGTCLNPQKVACAGGSFWANEGLSLHCPASASDLSCCLPENPVIKDVATIYAAAADYKAGVGRFSSETANQLVMEWLRHEKYNGLPWTILAGAIAPGFTIYANHKDLPLPETFPDPLYDGVVQYPAHMAAAMNAAYFRGEKAWQADVGGWAGDLFQLYAHWRSSDNYFPRDDVDSGYNFCREKMARKGLSRFTIRDLEEDADGFNIAHILRTDQNARIDAIVKSYFSPPRGTATSQKRFKDFYTTRFGGNITFAKQEAKRLLTSQESIMLQVARFNVIPVWWPWNDVDKMPSKIDANQLERFCQGFAEVLHELATTPNDGTPKPRSGWSLVFSDEVYVENDISMDLNEMGLYATVDGVKTVNTKCVTGKDFAVAGSPVTPKKGSTYLFETQIEPNPDTCCLEYFSNAKCDYVKDEFRKRCKTVKEQLPIAVKSWRVYGCKGKWTGEAQ